MSLFDFLRGDLEAMRQGPMGRCGYSRQFTKAGPGRRHVQGRRKWRAGTVVRIVKRLQAAVGPGSLHEYDRAMSAHLRNPADNRKPSRRTRKGDGSLVYVA